MVTFVKYLHLSDLLTPKLKSTKVLLLLGYDTPGTALLPGCTSLSITGCLTSWSSSKISRRLFVRIDRFFVANGQNITTLSRWQRFWSRSCAYKVAYFFCSVCACKNIVIRYIERALSNFIFKGSLLSMAPMIAEDRSINEVFKLYHHFQYFSAPCRYAKIRYH